MPPVRFTWALPILLGLPSLSLACASAPAKTLPLQRVRLYETGVAYFERSGTLEGKRASLPVPSAHLDDALKSLVVLGRDGSVDEVTFASRQSPAVARARAGLPAELARTLDLNAVLSSLRGERVEVQVGRETVRGRLFELVEPTDDEEARAALVVLTGAGAFRRLEIDRVDSVRPVDADTRARYGNVLDAGLGLRGATRGELSVLASLRGDITLGYLAETPIWRGTYRLVLPSDGSDPALQGWALVHNDTDEDWQEVQIELVNGRPSSFLFPLAAPRYERRDLEVPERELSSVPQLLTTNADAMWGDFVDDEGEIGLGSMGLVGHGGGGGGSGYGYGRGSGAVGRSGPSSSDLLSVGSLARITEAHGEETSMMFVYSGAKPVTIGGQRSALVPFLQRPITAEVVAHFEGFGGSAEHVLRLVNTTGQTLPEGTISVFADGGFGGEATLGRTRPGERRLLAVGPDLDTEMRVEERHTDEAPQRLVFRKGVLEEHYLRTSRTRFSVRNRSGHDREVQIALSVTANAKIDGIQTVVYDADAGRALLSLEVPARGHTPELAVTVVEGLQRSSRLDQLDADALERLAAASDVPESERKVVVQAGRHQAELARAQRERARIDGQIATAEKDLERLRQHLAALGDKAVADARHPLVARLITAEDRLEELRRAQATTVEQSERATTAMHDTLTALAPKR